MTNIFPLFYSDFFFVIFKCQEETVLFLYIFIYLEHIQYKV